jgi:hypothetical protein
MSLPPRNVIYFNSNANPIGLAGIANLPYTDVIIGFLFPEDDLKLIGKGGAFDSNLQSNVQALQNAGKNVLISFGGSRFPSSAYQSYAQNVGGLVDQIVNFVTTNGFNGVDIDYEDDSGFTGTYDGIGFLSELTNGLYQALLPSGQNIITHARKHLIGMRTQSGKEHTLRYGSKWVIRLHGLTTNSTTTPTMIKTPPPRYFGMGALLPLLEHKNF